MDTLINTSELIDYALEEHIHIDSILHYNIENFDTDNTNAVDMKALDKRTIAYKESLKFQDEKKIYQLIHQNFYIMPRAHTEVSVDPISKEMKLTYQQPSLDSPMDSNEISTPYERFEDLDYIINLIRNCGTTLYEP